MRVAKKVLHGACFVCVKFNIFLFSGQVHLVTPAGSGFPAAMKIQYPGVAEGIQSDIDNLVGILKVITTTVNWSHSVEAIDS